MGNYRQCEITNSTYSNSVNNLRIKSLVQIFSTNGKKFVCLGSLVHPRAVLTTLECVSTWVISIKCAVHKRSTIILIYFSHSIETTISLGFFLIYSYSFSFFAFGLILTNSYSHDKLYVKMKETVDTFQNLYQIRNISEIILPDNHMDRFEKLRFNMVKTGLNRMRLICSLSFFVVVDLTAIK